VTSRRDEKRSGPYQEAAVEDLLRLQGYSTVEEDVKARIAVGGAAAVESVVASRRGSIFDTDPGTFLSELERLGGPDEP